MLELRTHKKTSGSVPNPNLIWPSPNWSLQPRLAEAQTNSNLAQSKRSDIQVRSPIHSKQQMLFPPSTLFGVKYYSFLPIISQTVYTFTVYQQISASNSFNIRLILYQMTIYKYIIVETKGQDLLLETIYIPKTSIYQLVWYLKALLRLLLYLYTPKTHLQ